ncbi:DUF302 domain-containing protein [Marinobacter sp. F3R08]|uniref:DUF302 domain-containing protein n=1 Tax=Marinobacter sp. F3R08 TaxID=2841559 RepID=UPI001C0932CF|nr:DUF302 domain-containing protein [Marinobacter sp. F3R08]MBU2953016.1 DUF302 domain-containing protein [Marinobacter sp. F3R08]
MKALKILAVPLLAMAVSGMAQAAEGLITVKSNHSVAATADKLEAVLSDKGMKIMNRINHAEGAAAAGLVLRPTELVIFGNPKVGTPLMQCAQSVAIDLPQKALIWEDANGDVWLGYNDPQYLKSRHGIEGCDEVLNKVSGALGNFAKAATR